MDVEKLRLKWIAAYDAASSFQLAHADRDVECQRLWKRYSKLDKKLYKLQQKAWEREWLPYAKDWHPYGAFAAIPWTMILMVERCYTYWTKGYNVHIVEEEVAPIRASVTKAYEMAQRLKTMTESGEYMDNYDAYRKLLFEFFMYVGSECDNWGD